MRESDFLSGKNQPSITQPSRLSTWLLSKLLKPINSIRRRAASRGLRELPNQHSRLRVLQEEEEWTLIILDACRFDALSSVFDEYFIGEISPVKSVAHDTFEYVRLCWPEQYDDVTYISAAPAINSKGESFENEWLNSLYKEYIPADHLKNIVDVWEYGWDISLGTCPPEPVTQAALENKDQKMVVHYVQPHTPFIGKRRELGHTEGESAKPFSGAPTDEPVWDRVKLGEIDDDRLRELYQSNLERVLPEVCRLIKEISTKKIVITADHGEALGEFGTYAHPRIDHRYIRTVPWAIIDDVRDDVYPDDSPDTDSADPNTKLSIEDRLQNLGYLGG